MYFGFRTQSIWRKGTKSYDFSFGMKRRNGSLSICEVYALLKVNTPLVD